MESIVLKIAAECCGKKPALEEDVSFMQPTREDDLYLITSSGFELDAANGYKGFILEPGVGFMKDLYDISYGAELKYAFSVGGNDLDNTINKGFGLSAFSQYYLSENITNESIKPFVSANILAQGLNFNSRAKGPQTDWTKTGTQLNIGLNAGLGLRVD